MNQDLTASTFDLGAIVCGLVSNRKWEGKWASENPENWRGLPEVGAEYLEPVIGFFFFFERS